jgi:hypothetical protein
LKFPQKSQSPEWYATDFIAQLQLDSEVEQKCNWSCLLWSKEHWAAEANKAQVNLQQSKGRTFTSADHTIENLSLNAQFLNTVAQVYGKLFGYTKESCNVKIFDKCPYLDQRQDLLIAGSLASVFVTILHKAMMYAMLDRHPLDSGLLLEEYADVYGINLTNFQDLEESLLDGRFAVLYETVLGRAKQLAGISP